MAENAAHLTTNLMENPSIFEVIAADSLFSTFYPALKRIANFLVLRNPEKFKYLGRYYDEIFLVCSGLIQNHYLKTHGGSIAEVFYGLTRSSKSRQTFGRREYLLSLLALVAAPYANAKLNDLIRKYQDELAGESQINHKEFKKNLINFHKYFLAIFEFLKLIQYLRYLAKFTPSHSPLLAVTNMCLTYGEEEPKQDWTWQDLFRGKLKFATVLSGLLLNGLESSAFFLQFLQWWQTEAQNTDLTNLPIPQPPTLDPQSQTFRGICPICLQNWKTPTACSLSGYVYCYKCIVKNIEANGRCPVTSYEISLDDLIRIYDS